MSIQVDPRTLNGRKLLSMEEAAAVLQISPRTMRAHVAAAEIRYIIVGMGRKRPKKLFDPVDIEDFIANRKRVSPCPSTNGRGRPSIPMTSSSKVIDFPVPRGARQSAKPKPRKTVSVPRGRKNWVGPSAPPEAP